jgi:hypothetical protein
MGTQFTSRLKLTDRKRIYKGIMEALADQLPPSPAAPGKGKLAGAPAHPKKPRAGKTPPAAESIKLLSSAQRQQFGEATARTVLEVAADHGFFEEFGDSQLFIDVLKWLQSLRSDAEFEGFKHIIQKYGMAKSDNPVGDLARQLEKITNQALADKFRVSVSAAAKAILGETSLRKVPPKQGEPPARTLGRQLNKLSSRELVKVYIHRFVYGLLSDPMSKSDPESSKTVVQEAIGEVEKATERIAGKAVAQIVKEGKLNDPGRIHQIVLDALREFRKPKAA